MNIKDFYISKNIQMCERAILEIAPENIGPFIRDVNTIKCNHNGDEIRIKYSYNELDQYLIEFTWYSWNGFVEMILSANDNVIKNKSIYDTDHIMSTYKELISKLNEDLLQ